MSVQTEASKKIVEISTPKNNWFYPNDLENHLTGIDLPADKVHEALNTAWEYVVDVVAGDYILGFQLEDILNTVFAGYADHIHSDMAREFRNFLLFTSEKVSERRRSDFFRRYVNALARSPNDSFQLRDCDSLPRFTIAGALVCNEVTDVWFREENWQVLCEIVDTLYEMVSFYKHRAEEEVHDTFAYFNQDPRIVTFHRCREILWRFEVAWAHLPKTQCVINFIRNIGGPLHMSMRRYRYVEDGLSIGKPETEEVVNKTRHNFKLWNGVDAKHIREGKGEGDQLRSSQYFDITA